MAAADTVFSQIQAFVHGSYCTLVLPGMLLATSAAMLAYRQATEDVYDLPLNGFLANILLQMMPLVALKAKIWSCTDRISLVPLVIVKTLLMHVILEILRLVAQAIPAYYGGKIETMSCAVDFGCLCMALGILHSSFGFPLSVAKVFEHRDVRNLVVLAVGAAFVSEAFFVFVEPSWLSESSKRYISGGIEVSKVLFVGANYVDIVAFMPVVWRLYQAENEHEDCAVGLHVSTQAKSQVQLFFGFLFCFYAWDDVIDPILHLLDEPIAMMAHAAHFMLLLDFAGFFMFQAGTPTTASSSTKERGEQLQGLLSEEGLED